MNPNLPQPSREDIEVRITALLLGELPPAEAELLRWTISQDAELAKVHDRLQRTLGLVREVVANPDDVTAKTSAPLPDEQIIRLEGIGLVRICLAALEPRTRELIRLKFNEELSYQEISARTGLSVGNVGYQLHHALKTIGVELAKTGVLS